ncbi:hypothetical protein M9458_012017, partial [Cirrhinus mrigala]
FLGPLPDWLHAANQELAYPGGVSGGVPSDPESEGGASPDHALRRNTVPACRAERTLSCPSPIRNKSANLSQST